MSARAFDLFLAVDRSCGKALGRQIEDQLRTAIRSGKLHAGRDLPSTRALAVELAISRGVVVRAYGQLADEGYLEVRRGAAPCVRESPTASPAPARMPDSHRAPGKARYDLRPHLPEVGMFPRHDWLRSLRHAVTSAGNVDLNYGDPQGLAELRTEVSAYLGRARGIAADPDQIIITAGCTHSVSLILRMLARRGATKIGLENPSQSSLHTIAERAGLTPIGVALDEDGILVGELAVTSVPAVLVSAGHQFPTGASLSPARQAALVRWATGARALVIEDEYDETLRPDWTPISARDDLARDRVIYVGSTGKTLSPAVRLGWAVLPRRLARPLAEEVASSIRQIPPIEQLAFADFLRRGQFDRHQRRVRHLFHQRRHALAAALEEALPDVRVREAAALNVMIELDSVELERAAFRQAGTRGIRVETLSQHTLPGYRGPVGLLLGLGGLPDAAIAHVVGELAQALASVGAFPVAA